MEIPAEHVAQVSAAAPRIPAVPDDQIDLSDVPETDFTSPDAVRGKYYGGMKATLGYVLLEPDVRRAFPDADAVNRVLRSLIEIANNSHSEKSR